MPLDADSRDYLEDVKKGKPRRFVMICRGVRILNLVVYKKGSVERYKKQAKEEGRGQFYHGVIDGKGLDIAFKLCRDDGYEKPPGKELILKDYLFVEAGMRFKPVYEIVDVLPEVAELDELEGVESEGDEQDTPPEAPPMPEPGTYTSSDLAAECKRLKGLLYPEVKEAVAAHPDKKEAFTRLLISADKSEKAADFAGAVQSYQQLSALLTSLPAAEEKEQEGESTQNPGVLFNERLKALLPEVKAAAGTLAGDEAKRLAGEAGAFAKKKDFAEANSLLDEAKAILDMHGGDADTDVDPAVLFNDRLRVLLTDVKAAAGTPAGDAAKLKVSEAGVFAKKKDFARANALLDEAGDALQGTGGPSDLSDIAPGIVKKRTFLLERWRRIPEEISADLKGLQKVIESELPDEDADLLIDLSEDYLNDFYDEMKEAIDNDINSGDAQYKNAISTIQSFRAKIDTDPLVQHLKQNTLQANVTVDSILLSALKEVEQTLAS